MFSLPVNDVLQTLRPDLVPLGAALGHGVPVLGGAGPSGVGRAVLAHGHPVRARLGGIALGAGQGRALGH